MSTISLYTFTATPDFRKGQPNLRAGHCAPSAKVTWFGESFPYNFLGKAEFERSLSSAQGRLPNGVIYVFLSSRQTGKDKTILRAAFLGENDRAFFLHWSSAYGLG
jgi:hypothetical protein